MKRSVIAIASLFASVASAQTGGMIVGRTLPLHTPTPPPLPIRRFKPQPFRGLQAPRSVVFVPSYLYNVAPYTPAYEAPEVPVTVNNYNYLQGSAGPEPSYMANGLQLFAGGYLAGRLWNPQPVPDDSAAPSSTAPEAYKTPPPPQPADVASLDAIVNAYYDVVSGPPIKGRDWNRFRSLFAQGAHLIATLSPPGLPVSPMVMTSDEYATTAAPLLQRGFFEKEIFRTVEQFGRMAQVFSTYESRYHDTDVKPFQRGVNSIQLLNDGTRWWIVSMYWDAERPDNPIPAKYLPPKQ